MENRCVWIIFLFLSILSCILAKNRFFVMDERWVCAVKVSCFECLKLSQCSWCMKDKKCFSNKLWINKECTNSTVEYSDFGFSIIENAECSCEREKSDQNCYSPEGIKDKKCSGRGNCVCGRCVCDSDPENPSKVIMGEYCEYDNFSCEGPKCAEGPYHISQLYENDGSFKTYRDDTFRENEFS